MSIGTFFLRPRLANAPKPGRAWLPRTQRWCSRTTIMASGLAFVDGSVVNVALPTIARSF